ncbi:MAG TPA: 2Fe-2S iron-sulfur cluster-binding protein [Gemmatimonadaceae bacterium]|jgi:NADH-quinone oxidoreductase subunit G|nr:2Fe-2S iron-sulfur cluster-binding protein [Gemmatimonadaceae bacterium]
MDEKMVNLTIEGRTATVPEGTSILEAAKTVGILIPHYCYHPSLSIAGNCRMCQVQVEKQRKLMPACATAVADGQVVHVYAEDALRARQGVLEHLLINHPLDCPICDKSGECELQDYTYQEGRAEGRLREPKRFNPTEDFGGDVLYVTNRCILCTRCVRFMAEKAQDPVLNISERGDRAVIGKVPGHDLTDPWAGNVIYLCPVGALLSKDALNKVRSWEMDRTPSICPGCSQGCNIVLETRDNTVVRLQPRPNHDVNEFFMCDEGRLGYRWMNRQDRVEYPMVRRGDGLATAEWEAATAEAASLLSGRRAFVLASPNLSNEALFMLSRIAKKTGGAGAFRVRQGPEAPLPGAHDLALRVDRAANGDGAALMGLARDDAPLARMQDGDVLIVADEDLAGVDAADAARAGAIIVIGTTLPAWARHAAAVVLPITNFAEEEGTFTNLRGRVQRFRQAKSGPGFTRSSWLAAADLLTALGEPAEYLRAQDVFDALATANPEFAGMSYATLGLRGALVASAASAGAVA